MSFPRKFEELMKDQLKKEYPIFMKSLQKPPVISIRLNPLKNQVRNAVDLNFSVDSENIEKIEIEPVPWNNFGKYLSKRPKFGYDPLWHAGCYYVQEASSMLIGNLIEFKNKTNLDNEKHLKAGLEDKQNSVQKFFLNSNQNTIQSQITDLLQKSFESPVKILDLCAAPGGKSTLISGLLNQNSILISNEVVPKRCKILIENLQRWGDFRVFVTQNQPRDFKNLPEFFDYILIDAPCSGEGLLRKDEFVLNNWSVQSILGCAERQLQIVEEVLPSLKSGGKLIYSTCTFNSIENENVIEQILKIHANLKLKKFNFPESWGLITSSKGMYRCYPHKVKGEGLFFAVLEKTPEDNSFELNFKKKEFSFKNEPNFAELLVCETEAKKTLPGVSKIFKKLRELGLKELTKNEIVEVKKFFNCQGFHLLKKESEILAIPVNFLSDFLQIYTNSRMFKMGINLGRFKQKDFLPSQELAWSEIYNSEIRKLDLDYLQAISFLQGKEIAGLSLIQNEKNKVPWLAVCYQNITLGWVKNVGKRLNNYYPKSLRLPG